MRPQNTNTSPQRQLKPPKKVDRHLQTEPTSRCHKKCQAVIVDKSKVESRNKVKTTNQTIQTEKCPQLHKKCQAGVTPQEKSQTHVNTQTSPNISPYISENERMKGTKDAFVLTEDEYSEYLYDVGGDNVRNRNKLEKLRSDGHKFPFVGESPSGNLKIPPHMVISFFTIFSF